MRAEIGILIACALMAFNPLVAGCIAFGMFLGCLLYEMDINSRKTVERNPSKN